MNLSKENPVVVPGFFIFKISPYKILQRIPLMFRSLLAGVKKCSISLCR